MVDLEKTLPIGKAEGSEQVQDGFTFKFTDPIILPPQDMVM